MIKNNLFRTTIIICLVIAIVLPVYDIFFSYPSFLNQLMINTEEESVRLVKHITTMAEPHTTVLEKNRLSEAMLAMVRSLEKDFSFVKMKLFSPSGEIVYSTNQPEIGKINTKAYFHEIVAKGGAYSKVVRKGESSLEGQVYYRDVVETYVPIMRAGRFLGAIEVYHDITDRKAAFDRLIQRTSGLMIVMALVFLFILLGIILQASPLQNRRGYIKTDRNRAIRFLLITMAAIFIVELGIMSFLNRLFPHLPEIMKSLIDGFLLVLVLSPVLYFSIFRTLINEIGERKRAERILEEKSVYLDNILNSATDLAIMAAGESLHIKYYNAEAVRIFGDAIEGITRNNTMETYLKDKIDLERLQKGWQEASLGKSSRFTFRQERNGDTSFIETCLFGIRDKENKLAGYVAMARDITAMTRAQETMRRLSRSVEFAGESIIITDLSGVIRYVNPAFTRLTGYTKEEAVGQNPKVLKSGRHGREFYADMWATILNGEVWSGELTNKRKDGSFYEANLTIAPVFNSGTQLEGFVAVQRDITERKALEKDLKEKTASLEELNRNLARQISEGIEQMRKQEQLLIQQSKLAAMGEMIGAIAHQWRQPLNAIGIFVQDLEDAFAYGELDNEYLRLSVSRVMSQINYMSDTIDDFRNFFKPAKEKTVFDVRDALEKVLSILTAQLKHYNILCTLNAQGHAYLSGYPNEFKQVIVNIINNAKDAIIDKKNNNLFQKGEEGYVEVSLQGQEKKVAITVTDNGGGIAPSIIDRIFEPYFTTKKEGLGTGIGLFMSKAIIENNMGGKLYAHNTQEGTTFTIEFLL